MEGVTQPIFSTLPHRNLLDGKKDLQALIFSGFFICYPKFGKWVSFLKMNV